MFKTKHTPSPWRVKDESETGHCCFEWSIIAMAGYFPGSDVICEGFGNKANARLIASAPELLHSLCEALEIQEAFKKHHIENGNIDLAVKIDQLITPWKKVISMANGETL